MRLLLDANLSPRMALRVQQAGHDAVHVADLGLASASDEAIFTRAAAEDLVVVTADTDFSMLLALRQGAGPSVLQLRHVAELSQEALADLLLTNLPSVAADLVRGAIVSLSPTRLAVRSLPLG